MIIEPYNLNVVAPPGTQASPPAEMIEPYNLNVVVPSPKKLMNNYTAITCKKVPHGNYMLKVLHANYPFTCSCVFCSFHRWCYSAVR